MTLPKTELPLDDGPDARPKIAAGRDGKLIVTFATRDDKYNGHAFIARSERWREVLLGADADHHEFSKPTLRDGHHR